jgi:hypothetical protein
MIEEIVQQTVTIDPIPEEVPDDDTPLEIAPERREVKTDKMDLPVETLHSWVQRGKLDLQPMFQRKFVWNKAKASHLIESLILEIPIPVIYVAEDKKKMYEVVDGQQRLTSICAYLDGQFPDGEDFKLAGLQVLKELNGKPLKSLTNELQEKILGATLRLIVIEKESDPDVKFEVFKRLNLGAMQLNDQELRNCVMRGTYNDLLRDLTSNKHMLKIMGLDEPHYRMKDRELILRFFAMWRNTHLKYKGPMKQFLNREMENSRDLSKADANKMRSIFEKSIEMAFAVFGYQAFRRFNPGKASSPDGAWEKNKLNVALWDTILYTFSFFDKSQIIPMADAIREEFLDLMTTDQTFVEYISSTTDKAERVQYRADTWKQRVQSLVSDKQPRNFTLEFKTKLYNAKPTCQICKQRIHDVDDAEVDHVKHYWRGGKTIPENARLTHRYCNRARGGRS